ncbi:MAG TPA: metallophosphoesterase [Patescibacteria group bacterium]|nr:metallophosphoesterase [Patescibacteria group bacterium]
MKSSEVRFGAMADPHCGGEEALYGSLQYWKTEAQKAKEKGASFLALAGDITHRGKPEEAALIAGVLVDVFGKGNVFTVLGNHDLLSGQERQIKRILERRGVVVMDDKATVRVINGQRVGFIGMNGSVSIEEHSAIAKLPPEARPQAFHAITARRYLPQFLENLAALERSQVDAIVALIHIPITRHQYSDLPHDRLHEMTDQTALALESASAVAKIAVGGHSHSSRGNPMWMRLDPVAYTENGLVALNVAGPTSIYHGRDGIEVMSLFASQHEPVRRLRNSAPISDVS